MRRLLIRGMLCGLLAGLLGAAVGALLGDGPAADAIDFEASSAAAAGAAAEPELVSRTVQRTAGLLTGTVVFGGAVGGVFALAYGFAQGRLGQFRVRGTAAVVGLALFSALFLIPWLKYPANPPAVGDPETIQRRTALYLAMLLVAAVAVLVAAVGASRLRRRRGTWTRTGVLLPVVGALAIVVGAYAFLPPAEQPPAGFPTDVLQAFRIASVATHATIWATVTVLFSVLTERSLVLQDPEAGVLAPG